MALTIVWVIALFSTMAGVDAKFLLREASTKTRVTYLILVLFILALSIFNIITMNGPEYNVFYPIQKIIKPLAKWVFIR